MYSCVLWLIQSCECTYYWIVATLLWIISTSRIKLKFYLKLFHFIKIATVYFDNKHCVMILPAFSSCMHCINQQLSACGAVALTCQECSLRSLVHHNTSSVFVRRCQERPSAATSSSPPPLFTHFTSIAVRSLSRWPSSEPISGWCLYYTDLICVWLFAFAP